MKPFKNLMYGSDAEFFITTVKGEPIPAIGMVGGTKEHPKTMGQGYFIQEDNVAVEFNIPPAKKTRDFAKNIIRGLNKCREQLPAAVMPSNAASLVFDRAYIEGNPKALEFGCEPDINAWTRQVNPRPRATDRYLRSAGGHVHISWDDPDMEQRFELIKACDVFCSLPALWEDNDTRRRELYGKAGAMRVKPYGVEHRVLSNYWIFNEMLASTVANRYDNAVSFLNSGHRIEENDNDLVVQAINTGNIELAEKILQKYLDLLERGLHAIRR